MSSLFPSGYTSHDISPTAVSDLAKKKDYWRGGKDEKAFYSAQVMELGVTKAELIQRVSKRKITAMDFEESEPATTVAQIHESAAVGPCVTNTVHRNLHRLATPPFNSSLAVAVVSDRRGL
ncbi:uncharacterized protein LOC144136345 [Amblyomma americanum]